MSAAVLRCGPSQVNMEKSLECVCQTVLGTFTHTFSHKRTAWHMLTASTGRPRLGSKQARAVIWLAEDPRDLGAGCLPVVTAKVKVQGPART